MTARVAYNIQTEYTRAHNANDNVFNKRRWTGLLMVVDALRRGGIEVDAATSSRLHEYDVALFSITASCDWAYTVRALMNMRRRPRWVVAGGPGVLNVLPFRHLVDAFVFGRAEHVAVDLVRGLLEGAPPEIPSVAYSETFDPNKVYKIAQAPCAYPHEYQQANGKPFKEYQIGCKNKCFFCAYAWLRKPLNLTGTYRSGIAEGLPNNERTIEELDKLPPEHWLDEGRVNMVGMDGSSERLRCMVNKPITRDMVRNFFKNLSLALDKPYVTRLYNIVGYPTETQDDWAEWFEDLAAGDAAGKAMGARLHRIALSNNILRAMPATPAACWPMQFKEFRLQMGQYLRRFKKHHANSGQVFFQGRAFFAEDMVQGAESISLHAWDVLCLRGDDRDVDLICSLATNKKYWAASADVRRATLEKYMDIARLYGRYTLETLPTRYLEAYTPRETVYRLGTKALEAQLGLVSARAGGVRIPGVHLHK